MQKLQAAQRAEQEDAERREIEVAFKAMLSEPVDAETLEQAIASAAESGMVSQEAIAEAEAALEARRATEAAEVDEAQRHPHAAAELTSLDALDDARMTVVVVRV